MNRAALALFLAFALLAQGGAWAVAVTSMTAPMAVEEPGMPCHGGEEAPAAQKQAPCCGESCDCPELCAGHAAVVAPVFAFVASEQAIFESPPSHGLRLGAHHASPLRPPIRLNSL